jgi:hypothetical protein
VGSQVAAPANLLSKSSFVCKALKEDHAAVVIATPAHRQELNEQLMESGHDLVARGPDSE